MTDSRPGYDEPLPWLEAVDDEDGPGGVPARRMLGALVVVLLAAVIVSVTFFWLGRQDASQVAGAPELIRAEPGPYKVRPPNPGGLDVAGESQTAFETSAGQDTDAQLDVQRLPQQQQQPNATPAPAEAEPAAPAAAAEAPAEATGAKGSVIQMGFFDNRTQAERAWSALSARFPELGGMDKMVIPFSSGMRLRAGAASPEQAREMCRTLQAGGENCFVAN
jgi:hypothetical protein